MINSEQKTTISFGTTHGRPDPHGPIGFLNPTIRGLSEDIAAIDLGRRQVSFKSATEPKIIEIEVDLVENFERFKRILGWFEEVASGSPCVSSSKRRASIFVGGHGAVPIRVICEGAFPVGWSTSAFDISQAPRLTIAVACDAITFNVDATPLDVQPSPESGATKTASSLAFAQSLKVDTVTAPVESCSGFKVALECERVWDVKAGRLVHTIAPGRTISPTRFIIKPSVKSGSGRPAEDLVSSITAWYASIEASHGRPKPRDMVYTYSLNGVKDREFSIRIDEARLTSFEIQNLAPGKDPTIAFDTIASLVTMDGFDAADVPRDEMEPSLRGFEIHPQYVSPLLETIDYRLPAFLLRPRYLVPSVSRKMTRPDVTLGLSSALHNILRYPVGALTGDMRASASAALVQPERGAYHYDPSETKNPQVVNEVSFYVYATNPWPGHQMETSDLCVHLENIFFPVFYSFGSEEFKDLPDVDLLRTFELDAAPATGAIGWRKHREHDLQLPQLLFGRGSGESLISHPCERPLMNIPVVVSFDRETRAEDDANAFARTPITGLLTGCGYTIDQWTTKGEPHRAVVTLILQELRGLSTTHSDLKRHKSPSR